MCNHVFMWKRNMCLKFQCLRRIIYNSYFYMFVCFMRKKMSGSIFWTTCQVCMSKQKHNLGCNVQNECVSWNLMRRSGRHSKTIVWLNIWNCSSCFSVKQTCVASYFGRASFRVKTRVWFYIVKLRVHWIRFWIWRHVVGRSLESADMLFGLCVDSKSDDWFGRSSQCETALRANCLWLWLQTTWLQMV